MAKRRSRGAAGHDLAGAEPPGAEVELQAGEPTGAMIITFRDEAMQAGVKSVASALGIKHVASTADFKGGVLDLEQVEGSDALVLADLGIEIVSAEAVAEGDGLAALTEGGDSAIEGIEPEYMVEAIGAFDGIEGMSAVSGGDAEAYYRGFRDGSAALYRGLRGAGLEEAGAEVAEIASFVDTAQYTWGLQATNVHRCRYTGRGLRVAVLDTGFDLRHPDFRGRQIVTASFVPGETVQDVHGHGTHCIGTAMGPLRPPSPPGVRRYGCAPGADIYAGKVLNNRGGGPARQPLAGINWAVSNNCTVISMSLGYFLPAGAPESIAFEAAARRALDRGSLVVAAAGNEGPLGGLRSPANVPSVMAVGAVDSSLRTASFSSRGDVNIAGPGVNVFSTVPMPRRYGTMSGTSMACPHVAGIAALWAESNPRLRGRALWSMLQARARRLPFPANQVGAGLVQAPA